MAGKRGFWHSVHWWVLGPCVAAFVLGLVILALPIEHEVKFFVSGALIGVGAGAAIPEISGAFDRAKDQSTITQLLAPELAKYRQAYRMGEFNLPLALKISRGEYDDREVIEGLAISERIGVRSTLESAIRNQEKDPDVISWHIEQAVADDGEQAHLFFRIGSILPVMRAPGIESTLDDGRAQLMARIQGYANTLRQFSLAPEFMPAWANFATLWTRGALVPKEIYTLLLAFHVYFLLFGDESNGFSNYNKIVNDLAELDVRTGSPTGITEILRPVAHLRDPATEAEPQPEHPAR